MKEQYVKYLNKRRENNLPIEKDLKLITFVGQAFCKEFIWVFERTITDPLIKELYK